MANPANSPRMAAHIALALLAVFSFAPFANAQLERPVDAKLFCGQGMDGYAQAVAYIQTRAVNQASITRLTPEFACNLAAFLKAAPPSIGVKVGWYEVAASVATHGVSYCQRFQCKEGTNSHPRGLAADLLFGGTKGPGGNGGPAWCAQNSLCTWAHQNAHTYGLMFRLMPNSGCAAGYFEPWHIELKGVANCQGSDTFLGMSASAAPLGLGNMFRSMIGQDTPASQPTQQMQVTTSQQPAIAVQPVSISQSPLSAFEETSAGVSSQITGGTNAATGSSTAADRLEELTFGPKATSTQSATSVPLVVTGSQAAGLAANQNQAVTQSTQSGVTSASQQTFVSGDLSWQNETFSSQSVSGLQAILITIRSILLRILPYLEPFGDDMPEAAS